jgi:hypothetical protein
LKFYNRNCLKGKFDILAGNFHKINHEKGMPGFFYAMSAAVSQIEKQRIQDTFSALVRCLVFGMIVWSDFGVPADRAPCPSLACIM